MMPSAFFSKDTTISPNALLLTKPYGFASWKVVFLRIIYGRISLFHGTVSPQNPFVHDISGSQLAYFSLQVGPVIRELC